MIDIIQVYSIIATAAISAVYLLFGKSNTNGTTTTTSGRNIGIETETTPNQTEGILDMSNDVTYFTSKRTKLANSIQKPTGSEIEQIKETFVNSINKFESKYNQCSVSMASENYPTFVKLFNFNSNNIAHSDFYAFNEIINKELHLLDVKMREPFNTFLLVRGHYGSKIRLSELVSIVSKQWYAPMNLKFKLASGNIKAIIAQTNFYKKRMGAPQLLELCQSKQAFTHRDLRTLEAICQNLSENLISLDQKVLILQNVDTLKTIFGDGFNAIRRTHFTILEIDLSIVLKNPALTISPYDVTDTASQIKAVSTFVERVGHVTSNFQKIVKTEGWVENLSCFDFLKLAQYSTSNYMAVEKIVNDSPLAISLDITNNPDMYMHVVETISTIILSSPV